MSKAIIARRRATTPRRYRCGRRQGGKIHAAVTRDGIPVAVAYTSASLHDSQVMIPLVKKASERMEHGFDLADAAYDAETIREVRAEEGCVPVIDANSRRGEQRRMTDTEREIFKDRGTDERFFSHLLDAHGGRRTSTCVRRRRCFSL